MGFFDGLRRSKKTAPLDNESTDHLAQEDSYKSSDIENAVPIDRDADSDEENPLAGEGVVIEDIQVVDRLSEPGDKPPEPTYRKIKGYAEKKPVKHAVGATKIFAIINQKGGVGKSTTAINLAAALGERGKQVLLVDLDPQGNATSGLGVNKGEIDHCIYDVLLNDLPIEEVIVPDLFEGFDLAPATIDLAGAEVELVPQMARENRLKDSVGSLRGRYDYILIDCPPSLGILTVNALVAADKLIIPIQCEFYALEGVTKLLDSMKRVKARLNPSLDVFGILLTMYDGRTTLSRQVAQEVRSFFGKQVFETMIPRAVKLSEAPSYGLPITQYDPKGRGAEAYTALAKEVILRG